MVFAVIGLLSRVDEVYHSTDRHAIRLATDISLLLALSAALHFVEHLLKPVVTEKQSEESHAT